LAAVKRPAFLLVLACCAIGFSRLAAQDLRFQLITTDHGLNDNGITCLLEDRDGFIWIGTERGLNRFEGSHAHSVPGIADRISALAQAHDGAIWIGTTDNGLFRWDGTALQHFIHSEADPASLPTTRINDLFALDDSTLMIAGSPAPVVFMNMRSGAFSRWEARIEDGSSAFGTFGGSIQWCHAFAPIGNDLLWLGMLNNQRSLLMRRSDRSLHRVIPNQSSAGPHHTRTCAAELNGIVYMGGWQRDVERMRSEEPQQQLTAWITPDETMALCAWGDRLVVATKRSGLLLFDNEGASFALRRGPTDINSLPTDQMRSLLADSHGNLWVGTSKGLAVHAPAVWQMQERILAADNDTDPEIHALLPLPDDGLLVLGSNWITTMRDGLPSPTVQRWGEGAIATCLSPPLGSSRLLGTETGLLRVHAGTLEPIAPFQRSRSGFDMGGFGEQYQVRGAFPDTLAGEPVWVVGALGYGVFTYRDHDGDVVLDWNDSTLHGVKELAMVRDMLRDEEGVYWCATDGGITRTTINPPAMRVFNQAESVALKQVRAIHLQGDTIWAVLRDGILISIHGDQLHVHVPPFRRGVIRGLASDARGRIWITTDDGLKRYDPRSDEWLHVQVNDGGTHRNLHGPIALLGDSRMAFASGKSIVYFDPKRFDDSPPLPAPYLVEASSAGRGLAPQHGLLTMSYREGALDIRLSAMPTGVPLPCRILYRLDGVESDWREAAAGELLRYAGLPVGEHRLMAKAIDSFGRAGDTSILLTVRITGPFWQQWWFYAIAALIISIGVYAWSRYRLAQALKLQAVRNRIASDLHDEVGSSLSSITIGSKLAAQLSTSESPQVKEILARIGETSSESLRSISDIVWAIDPKNDQGEALVKRMRRIANELLESKGMEVRFDVSSGVEELKLPMNARKEIVLIYKEAVHNASKYSGATRVNVSLHLLNGALSLLVHDNGKGFDPVLHPDGHGLGSMKRRAGTLGTVLDLRSTPGTGTQVGLVVDLTNIRD